MKDIRCVWKSEYYINYSNYNIFMVYFFDGHIGGQITEKIVATNMADKKWNGRIKSVLKNSYIFCLHKITTH